MKNKNAEIRFLEDCLLVDNCVLVLGDLHIGLEEHILKEGICLRVQLREILEKLNRVFLQLKQENIKIKKIIILGDLKHEFEKISNNEWRDTLKVLNYLENKLDKKNQIILIKGNHDNILGPIAKKKDIKLKNYYKFKNLCFLHGDKLFKQCLEGDLNINTFILGHLHPAITIYDKYKKEKYKCFLKGKWNKKIIYILPSFSPISLGYDLTALNNNLEKEGFLFIKKNSLKNFEVIIYKNKEYHFGKLKKLI